MVCVRLTVEGCVQSSTAQPLQNGRAQTGGPGYFWRPERSALGTTYRRPSDIFTSVLCVYVNGAAYTSVLGGISQAIDFRIC